MGKRRGFSEIGKILTIGDIYKTFRDVRKIVIHCSASPLNRGDDVHTIDGWHREKDWSGVGYHMIILEDGTIQKGRDFDKRGAHTHGHNNNSLGICRIGGYGSKYDATPEQTKVIKELTEYLATQYKDVSVFGHCKVSYKACPCMEEYKV